ncbi:hypothetical protein THIOSC15_2210015 [uncultured Thiomicrorhabdus sp.]
MAIQVGTVKSVTGVVKAVDKDTGVERVLTVGSPVYQGESIETTDTSNVLMNMNNGELVTLGRSTTMTLSDDVISSSNTDEGSVSPETIENMLAQGDIDLDALNLDELEATAAGEDGSANEGGVTIARLGLEGDVTSGFGTAGLNAEINVVGQEDNVLGEGALENTPPTATIADQGSTLLGLIGADYTPTNTASNTFSLGDLFANTTNVSSPYFGGSGNTAVELGVLDTVNYKPGKAFTVEDNGENDIDHTTMSVDNGIGDDLLGLSYVIGREEFVAPSDPAYDDYEYTTNQDGSMTVSRKDGEPMSAQEANYAMGGVETKDTSLLGSLLDTGITVGRTYNLYVEDTSGQSDSAVNTQFVSVGLLQNGTGGSLSNLVDVPLLNAIDPVTGMLDEALAPLLGPVFDTVSDIIGIVENITAPLAPIVGPINDLLNNVGSAITAGTGALSETPLGDPTLGQTISDIGLMVTDPIVNSDETLTTLLGGEPGQNPESGVVDDLIDEVTDVVDQVTTSLGIPTDTEMLDDGVNAVTTDVNDLLIGEQDLTQVVGSLLGGEPDEAITAGSVDQVVDGATDVVDQLTAGLGLPTDTENLDEGLNAVTTDVDDLLQGEQDLNGVLGSLLGGEPDETITAGSVDQVVDGATDVVDQLTAGLGLPTDSELLDDGVNALTSDVDDLLSDPSNLGQTVTDLLGDNGSVDQVINGATDVVTDITGIELAQLDATLDTVTTEVNNLVNSLI